MHDNKNNNDNKIKKSSKVLKMIVICVCIFFRLFRSFFLDYQGPLMRTFYSGIKQGVKGLPGFKWKLFKNVSTFYQCLVTDTSDKRNLIHIEIHNLANILLFFSWMFPFSPFRMCSKNIKKSFEFINDIFHTLVFQFWEIIAAVWLNVSFAYLRIRSFN